MGAVRKSKRLEANEDSDLFAEIWLKKASKAGKSAFEISKTDEKNRKHECRDAVVSRFRLAEIRRLYEKRSIGRFIPDDGRDYIGLMAKVASYCLRKNGSLPGVALLLPGCAPSEADQLLRYLQNWFPRVDERRLAAVADAHDEYELHHSSDWWGRALGIQPAERAKLAIKTMGDCVHTKEERQRINRAKERKYRQEKYCREVHEKGGILKHLRDGEFCRRNNLCERNFRNWKKKGLLEGKLEERGLIGEWRRLLAERSREYDDLDPDYWGDREETHEALRRVCDKLGLELILGAEA